MRKLLIIWLLLLPFACQKSGEVHLFSLMDAAQTGINFRNEVYNTKDFNIFSYRNFYNGAGVGIGDINQDGWADIFFTSNLGANKLYLNKGDWTFEDISTKAGIEETKKWSTGVAMVDINADGLLDIYVCNAGYIKGVGQENSLFINNGDLTFTEAAAQYGLNDSGYTTHAAFFDYDLDGDLDVYLLNNSFIPVNTLNYNNKRELRAKDWPVKDFLKGGGDKLMRNDGSQFTDVSEEAGIYGSLIGFGLGVTLGDVNGDAYPDIYVSNDFFERDYLYINNGDGSFSEELEKRTEHISLSSMGADMADINNDGRPEIFVTDMLPDEEYRLKTTASFENINIYNLKQERGFYHQFMQNSLQLNDHNERFREIAYYSGVAASDWSWGALMFDADNDSYTDIYVCNGIFHDVIDQDFIDFFANEMMQKMAMTGKKEEIDSVINKMPSHPIINKAFRNTGQLQFEDASTAWGFEQKSFSNGAAYADLDNDGDLDLVINNINQPAFIYQNHSNEINPHHYLRVQLKGKAPNHFAIGAKVSVFVNGQEINRQLIPTRGFQSSVDYILSFGLGDAKKIDSLRVIWPDQTINTLKQVAMDTLLQIDYQATLTKPFIAADHPKPFFQAVASDFDQHQEDSFIDFYHERNIPMKTSHDGPKAALGDVNGDALADVYIGGAAGQAGQLYLQNKAGFQKQEQSTFAEFSSFEDTAVLFFDADGDGDLDLFVGSGGNHQPHSTREMQDRLYLNDGEGNFAIDTRAFPSNGMNTAVAAAHDYDKDGDLDLFVGSRSIPGNYGLTPNNYLYENDGKGHFKDVAKKDFPKIARAGMITDALWIDILGNDDLELLMVGEWMSPKLFSYEAGQFKRVESNLSHYLGWWYTAEAADVDGDGDLDLFLGNQGENFYLHPTEEAPVKLWMKDFDENGSIEKVITRTIDQRDIPVPLKREMVEQVTSLKKQNLKHKDYATKSIQDLFGTALVEKATFKQVNYFKTCIAINEGNGQFNLQPLVPEVQLSCVNDALFTDINKDGQPDLILGGNNYQFLPQFSRSDASFGHVLLNKGNAQFSYVDNKKSGLLLDGELKQMNWIKMDGKDYLLALMNNQKPLLYHLN